MADAHLPAHPVQDRATATSWWSPTRTWSGWKAVRRIRRRSCGSSTSPTRSTRRSISTFQIEDMPDEPQPYMTGCHQPCGAASCTGTEIPVAWFAHGLRIVDIAKPHALKEVAYFMPDVPPGSAARAEQRRDGGRARADLPARPRARAAHPRARLRLIASVRQPMKSTAHETVHCDSG